MLGELYQYAIEHNLAARPGFKPKKPKAYVRIAGDGSFIGIDIPEKTAEPVMAPDIGSAANGTKSCNPLIEKACIPLLFQNKDDDMKKAQVKHPFFIKMLLDGAQAEPAFGIAAASLEDETFRATVIDALSANKIKPADPIGFKVDGMPLEASKKYLDWWSTYRLTISGKSSVKKTADPICLITGEASPALETVPKVSGLRVVGGHTSGDAFLCFDKDAFQSYGLKQSLNAPVSEEAMSAVNAALTKLIADAGVIGGAKIVHWYSSEVNDEEDLLTTMLGLDIWNDQENDDDMETNPSDDKTKRAELEARAMQMAESLCSGIQKGEMSELGNARYYIMPLSGAGGRMMVRGWHEGRFSELCRSFEGWFNDVRLVSCDGKGVTKNPKLMAMMIRLLKPGDEKKVYDRVNKELSNLSMRILQSVLNNSRLPDEVPVRALHWLISKIQSGENDKDENSKSRKKSIGYETMAYQWLKIWLLREQRAKGANVFMGEKLNPEYPGIAYQCGRMMAVYAAAQEKALRDVEVGVTQRYFAAASRAPGLVIGKLSALYPHHLAKIEDEHTVVHFERLLSDISMKIGSTPIPKMLTVEQQTEFALGYYQQKAAMWQKTKINNTDDN